MGNYFLLFYSENNVIVIPLELFYFKISYFGMCKISNFGIWMTDWSWTNLITVLLYLSWCSKYGLERGGSGHGFGRKQRNWFGNEFWVLRVLSTKINFGLGYEIGVGKISSLQVLCEKVAKWENRKLEFRPKLESFESVNTKLKSFQLWLVLSKKNENFPTSDLHT